MCSLENGKQSNGLCICAGGAHTFSLVLLNLPPRLFGIGVLFVSISFSSRLNMSISRASSAFSRWFSISAWKFTSSSLERSSCEIMAKYARVLYVESINVIRIMHWHRQPLLSCTFTMHFVLLGSLKRLRRASNIFVEGAEDCPSSQCMDAHRMCDSGNKNRWPYLLF